MEATLKLCRLRRNCFWFLTAAFALAVLRSLITVTQIVRHKEDWLIVLGLAIGACSLAATGFYLAYRIYSRQSGVIYQELEVTPHSPSDKLAYALSSATGDILLSTAGIAAFVALVITEEQVYALFVFLAGGLLFYPSLIESRQHYILAKQSREAYD